MDNKQSLSLEKAIEYVLTCAKTPIERKKLVVKCIEEMKLPAKALKDKKPGAQLNVIKCQIGNAIERLLQNKILAVTGENQLCLTQSKSMGTPFQEKKENEQKPAKKQKAVSQKQAINAKKENCKNEQPTQKMQTKNQPTKAVVEEIKRDIAIEEKIKQHLKEKPLTKKEVYAACVQDLKASLGVSDKAITSDAGRILAELVKQGVVHLEKGQYSLPKALTKEEKNELRFQTLTPESLVDHTVAMLEKWYQTHSHQNVQAKNIDGPQDGGIDGVITALDDMGYAEKMIVQVKHISKANKHVPLAEVREFCGVLSSDDATKGLFVTNGKYTQETVKFAKKYKHKYFVLIDGVKWLSLAKDCNYEI